MSIAENASRETKLLLDILTHQIKICETKEKALLLNRIPILSLKEIEEELDILEEEKRSIYLKIEEIIKNED